MWLFYNSNLSCRCFPSQRHPKVIISTEMLVSFWFSWSINTSIEDSMECYSLAFLLAGLCRHGQDNGHGHVLLLCWNKQKEKGPLPWLHVRCAPEWVLNPDIIVYVTWKMGLSFVRLALIVQFCRPSCTSSVMFYLVRDDIVLKSFIDFEMYRIPPVKNVEPVLTLWNLF